jgi:DNA repair protein SbcC/Rad50
VLGSQGAASVHGAVANAPTRGARTHVSWHEYFQGVANLVSSQQSDAIQVFTDTYGPRASVIQKRLRPVYGFGDVELSAEGSEISVRVVRDGEELRPTEFFSQSQQQTLLLGLFLTACSSQNWSAFTPIPLDDPVTHFDNLNTYALLDLISGLIDVGVDRHQFIISTCDEKLIELARRKFQYLGDRAKFYVFTSMGSNGPTVTEMRSMMPFEAAG